MKKTGDGDFRHKFSLTPLLLLTAALLLPVSALVMHSAGATVKDLTNHPVYSAYKFKKDGKHIYFGTQPLTAPTGLICEVMKRDAILRKNLEHIGMEVVFYSFLKGPDTNFFMMRDQIDMTFAGDMPAISIAATGKTIITGIAKLDSASIVTRSRYRNIRDMKGKRIGCPEGTTAHLGLLSALAAAGMKESEIRLVPLEVGELSEAMENNKIDAFSAWEPTVSAALSHHKDFKAIHRFLNSNYLYQTRQVAQQHPDASLQIHASFVRSLHWMNASNKNIELAAKWSLQAAEKMTGRKPEFSEQQLVRVTSEAISRIAQSPVIPQSDFKRDGFLGRSFEFLKNRGNIPPEASWEKISAALDNKMVKAVLADPAKYKLDNFYPELDK